MWGRGVAYGWPLSSAGCMLTDIYTFLPPAQSGFFVGSVLAGARIPASILAPSTRRDVSTGNHHPSVSGPVPSRSSSARPSLRYLLAPD